MLSDSDDEVLNQISRNSQASGNKKATDFENQSISKKSRVDDVEENTDEENLVFEQAGISQVKDTFEQESSKQFDEVDGGDGKLEMRYQIRHEVAVPPGYPYIPISQHVPSKNPAREYPFPLDPFQRVAINSIERNESVLVAAHTSAGKTVVAEYAIAQALRSGQRVIYTSPIKALSNQKFREFTEEFGDVGLMTGDVTINPSASCLVMTTEILRSMLYRGSEVMREVSWVVFDEVHYMRDKDRGVVWEETLILLPDKVRHVFLSATIPNAHQFAKWICYIHSQPCHVVYTDYRPTPLQHYMFPRGADGIHLVVDEKGVFREDNFERALSTLQSDPSNDAMKEEAGGSRKGLKKKGGGRRQGSGEDSDITKIIKMILIRNYHPVIVFSFGKRECEVLANEMSKIDFNTKQEHELVEEVFANAVSSLDEEDRALPQIVNMVPLLKRGIGIHHSGLLPVLKEVIELLFQEGLIKVLFATETFSIGLNMPAKTVVFTSVRKFDGKEQRWISGGEYIQMSGRAGRRGLDARGIVIMMIDSKIEPAVAKSMMKGVSDVLNSAFHITYNMLLNQLRVEGIEPEYILEKCFLHFQSQDNLPQLEGKLKQLKFRVDSREINITLENYVRLLAKRDEHRGELRRLMNHPDVAVKFLNPGRLARVEFDGLDFGVGIIVDFEKVVPSNGAIRTDKSKEGIQALRENTTYIVQMVLRIDPTSISPRDQVNEDKTQQPPLPAGMQPGSEKDGVYKVVPVLLSTLDGLSSIVIKLPSRLDTQEGMTRVERTLIEVNKRFSGDIKLLDPINNLKLDSEEVDKLLIRIKKLQIKMDELEEELGGPDALKEKLLIHKTHGADQVQLQELEKNIKSIQSVQKMDELKAMKRVLRRLNYISEADVVQVKGRVACELMSEHGLLLAELMFQGLFNGLTVEQVAALLSVFVYDERVDEKSSSIPAQGLDEPFKIIQQYARSLAQVSSECKLQMDPEEYVGQLKPQLMSSVFAWCRGATFSELCEMSSVFEGSLIRVFRRLEELLREMAQAAKAIGNTELEAKFAQAILLIKRGIIFSASLYL